MRLLLDCDGNIDQLVYAQILIGREFMRERFFACRVDHRAALRRRNAFGVSLNSLPASCIAKTEKFLTYCVGKIHLCDTVIVAVPTVCRGGG